MIPYRTRRFLRRLGTFLLAVTLFGILLALCWTTWIERYIIYTRDGVIFDFEQDYHIQEGVLALPPSEDDSVSIYFNEGDNALELTTELKMLKGYYISTKALADIPKVMETVKALEDETAVMIDVVSIKGVYYYNSAMPDANTANIDLNAADTLIQVITKGDYYAIARVPAFRNYYFGLNSPDEGLPYAGGSGYLWMDDSGCYWLRPDSTKVLNYLIQLTAELKALGFDEVVFTDFCFPNTEKIKYKGDKHEALVSAMNTLITNCNTTSFAVSFSVTDPTFPIPEGRSRLYLEQIPAKNVGLAASQVTITDPEIRLVFIADTNDTRYDDYGVIRPIDAATVLEQQ
jgi:hypothetical protein